MAAKTAKLVVPVIYNSFNRPKTIPAPAGKAIQPEYTKVVGEDGLERVEHTSDFDAYAMIQENRIGTEIYDLLERYQLGDVNALNRTRGAYVDVTGMPSSLAEAYARMQKAENIFANLPVEIRKEFNFSQNLFVKALDTDKPKEVFEAYFKSKNASLTAETPKEEKGEAKK